MKKWFLNFDFLKIVISAVLFAVSFLLRAYFIPYIIILIISYLVVSYEIYYKAFDSIKHGEVFDENLLMIIATIGAFAIAEYSEAVLVMLLYSLGEYLSDMATDHSRESITSLLDLRSDTITLKKGDEYVTVATSEAKIGDTFLVKPGEKIALDGIVIEGNSSLDTSSLTGESLPRYVKENDKVLSGVINLNSSLLVKATSEYTTSTTAKIMDLIENSDNDKAKKEKFITRFSKVYTPAMVLIALLIAIVPPIAFNQDLDTWVYRALELLVISCPCALVISIPLSYFCGIGKSSKEGILVKGSKELESLSDANIVAFDKTGTITTGKLQVNNIINKSEYSDSELESLIVHGEYYSNHPIARSIIDSYNLKIDSKRIKDFKEIAGYGVSAKVDKKPLLIGSLAFMNENDIHIHNPNYNLLYVAYDNKHIANIEISDTIKESAYTIKDNLAKLNINHLVILSGDDITTTKEVAEKVKIRAYFASLLPQDKVSQVTSLKNQGKVVFVGDGINDAPVMKVANSSIAMASVGNDVTMEACDTVIMNNDLTSVYKAIKIAKTTKFVVLTNLIVAIAFKLVMMVLSLLGLIPMYLAVFSDVGITLLLVLHSLTIMFRKIKAH